MDYSKIRSVFAFVLSTAILSASCSRGNSDTVSAPNIGNEVIDSAVRVSVDADAAEPAVVSDKDGNVYVLFVKHSAKSSADVYLQKYDPDLKPIDSNVSVSTDGSAKTWRGDPPTAAIGPDGSIYVGWTRTLPQGRGNDLVISTSRDGGKTFDSPVKVNDDSKPVSHGMHSLAVGSDGRVYAAWLDERSVKTSPPVADVVYPEIDALPDGYEIVQIHNGENHSPKPTPTPSAEEAEPNSEVFFSYSADGGKTFAPNKKIAADVCPCCKTSMLAAADGKIYVSWRQVLPGDMRHIAVTSTSDKGDTFSKSVIVSDDKWRLFACPVSGSALSEDGGKLLVSWYTAGDAGQPGLYSSESTDGGKTFGPRVLVSSTAGAGTPVLLADSKACLFATEDNAIKMIGTTTAHSNTIENAVLPAATKSGGKIIAVFVRPNGDKRSVWMAALPPA